MRKTTAFLLLLHLFFVVNASGDPAGFIVNSGHTGKVHDMEYSFIYDVMLSAGDDGRLYIWDIYNNHLNYKIPASHVPVLDISLHPEKPLVALLCSNQTNYHAIKVINWHTKKELYTKRLDELPAYFSFSGSGSYLYWGQTSVPPICIVNADTGEKIKGLAENSSIYSWAFIGESEETIMTYSPLGIFEYFSIHETKLLKSVKTLASLENFSVMNNVRYIFAATDSSIHILNRLNGLPVASISLNRVHKAAYNMYRDTITVIWSDSSSTYITTYKVGPQNNSLNKLSEAELTKPMFNSPISSLTTVKEFAFAGMSDGKINKVRLVETEVSVLGESIIHHIGDAELIDNNLLLSTDTAILKYIFDPVTIKSKKQLGVLQLEFMSASHNFENTPVFSKTVDNEVFLWDPHSSGSTAQVFKIRLDPFTLVPLPIEANAPIVSISSSNNFISILDKSGTITILDGSTFEKTNSFNSVGALDSALVERNILTMAKTRHTGVNSSLMAVNLRTQEISPIDSDHVISYNVFLDESNGNFYTIGVRKTSDRTYSTELIRYDNYLDNNPILLYGADLEDLDADFCYDAASNSVFTTIGGRNIIQLSGDLVREYDTDDELPEKITVSNKILVSLNTDNSLTFWETGSKKKIYTFYLFKDKTWFAVSSSYNAYTGTAPKTRINHFARHHAKD